MGGFFAGLGSALAGAGEQAGPFRDKENASRLRIWETTKANLLRSAEDLAQNATDPVLRSRVAEFYAKLNKTVPGDKNQGKLLQDFQDLHSFHPDLGPLFKQPEVPMGPGPAAPGSQPGSLQPQPQAAPPQSGKQDLSGNFASLLAPQAQAPAPAPSGPPAPPIAAQPTSGPTQSGSCAMSPMPSLSPLPQGSGSTTHDRLMASGIVTPRQWQVAQPIIEEELKQTAQKRHEQEIQTYLNSPEGKLLPDIQRGQLGAMAHGATLPNLPVSMMTPKLMSNNVGGHTAPAGQADLFGNPVDPKKNYRVEQSPMNGQPIWIPNDQPGQLVYGADGQAMLLDRRGNETAPVGGVAPVPTSYLTPRFGTTTNGQMGVTNAADIKSGKAPTASPFINTGLLPTINNTQVLATTTDKDGNQVQVMVPKSSTSSKGLPGKQAGPAVASAGAARGGGGATALPPDVTPEGQKIVTRKGLTPSQAMNLDVDLGTLDQTIDRMKSIQKRLPLLASLFTAKKIEFNTDAHGGIVSDSLRRLAPLSDEEAGLAADFISTMEDINKIRQPLGAAGFRGPEAFAALIAQAGRPGANPKVTSEVINNTLQIMNRIRAEKAKARTGRSGAVTGKVTMIAPNGETMPVDASQVEHYKSLGAKVQ